MEDKKEAPLDGLRLIAQRWNQMLKQTLLLIVKQKILRGDYATIFVLKDWHMEHII